MQTMPKPSDSTMWRQWIISRSMNFQVRMVKLHQAWDSCSLASHVAPGHVQMQLELTWDELSTGTAIGITELLVQGLKIRKTQQVVQTVDWLGLILFYRIALQNLITSVGKTSTLEEKVDIAQRWTRLGSWIISNQRQAHKYLDITDEEEHDQSYAYQETDIFNKTWKRWSSVGTGNWYAFLVFRICRDTRMFPAGQAIKYGNQDMHWAELRAGRKALIFWTNIRSAVSKKSKTCACESLCQ
jgi:hypothetical protein